MRACYPCSAWRAWRAKWHSSPAGAAALAAPPRNALPKRALKLSSPRSMTRRALPPRRPPARAAKTPVATPISFPATCANAPRSKRPSPKRSGATAGSTSCTTMPAVRRRKTGRSPRWRRRNSARDHARSVRHLPVLEARHPAPHQGRRRLDHQHVVDRRLAGAAGARLLYRRQGCDRVAHPLDGGGVRGAQDPGQRHCARRRAVGAGQEADGRCQGYRESRPPPICSASACQSTSPTWQSISPRTSRRLRTGQVFSVDSGVSIR